MSDPIRGKTLRFRFVDGVMANKTFEHRFAADGTVTFSAGKEAVHYELAPVREGIWAVSYLSKGYTLTTVLDFDSLTLVAFSSNDKMVAVQHGTFDEVEATAAEARPH